MRGITGEIGAIREVLLTITIDRVELRTPQSRAVLPHFSAARSISRLGDA